MQEFKAGRGYKWLFFCLNIALISLIVWGIVDSLISNNLVFAGLCALSLIFFRFGLVSIFRYKIIWCDDFIERVSIRRQRILLKDITIVVVENQQAFVFSPDARLHISQEISDRAQLLRALFDKLKGTYKTRIAGDPFVISHLLNTSDEKAKVAQTYGPGATFDIVAVRLVEKRWLVRELEAHTSRGVYNVAYYGRGMGYECVLVNGKVVDKKNSYFRYVPEFRFMIGNLSAVIKVRVWPWFVLRSLTLEVDGSQIYHGS